jgi:putative ABC transport system permease protein
VRQLLTESLLLALVGGALGVGLSVWLTEILLALSPRSTPRLEEVGMDARVLLFALGATLLTGLVFGLAPALQASKAGLNEALKEGGRGLAEARGRARGLLVVGEIAVSLVLLVGAGLLVKSFVRLQQVKPGFDASGVLTMRVSLPGARYPEPKKKAEFYASLVERLRALPGVESAGATLSLPLGGSNYSVGRAFVREGRPLAPEASENAAYAVVTPGYFKTLRVPLVKGRDFDERDTAEAPMVAVVNEALARTIFAGEDAVGRQLTVWRDEKFPRRIVGVVADVRPDSLDEEAGPQIYVPHAQDAGWGGMSLVVRTKGGEPESLTQAVRGEVRALDRAQPVYDVKTLEQVLADSAAYRRVAALLMAGFACVALVLACVGLYGVVSYAVARRTHEIGIRMALGARPSDVLRMVLRQGGALVLAGVGVGVAAALGAAQALAGMLYGVSATDASVYVFVALLLACVALLACLVPARRATKVDPMEALRYE